MPADLDDRQLAERARGGDDAAFGLLYERHAPRLHDFLVRVVRDPAAAEDLVQATFLRVYERRDTLRDPARVRSWIFTTAHNLAMNHLEQRRPSEPVEEAWDLPAAGRGPEAEAASGETVELVWDAAAGLEPRQYAVLDMAVRQELTTPEIAEVLGVPSAHAAVLVNRAREALGNAVRYLLVARRRDRCERLATLVPQGVRALTREQRSAVDYHMRRCDTCQATARLVTAPEELFAAIPLLALPPSLRTPPWHQGAAGGGPGASAAGARVAVRPWWAVVAAVAAGAVVAGVVLAMHHGGVASGGARSTPGATRSLDLASVAAHGFSPVALPAGALPQSAFLVDATCPTATDCYVVGSGGAGSGLLLATHDGARSWKVETVSAVQSLGAVGCSGALSCWVGGGAANGDGVILHTGDGRTWQEQMRRSNVVVGSVACPTASGCIAVGTDFSRNLADVLATTDGGATWLLRSLPAAGARVLAVRCWDVGHCLAVGSDAWATEDLGATWRATASVQSTPAPGAAVGSIAALLEDAAFVSASDVWVIGGNQCGGQNVTQCPSVLFHSTDGGTSWSPSSPDLARQSFPFGWQLRCTGGSCLVIAQAFHTSTILVGEGSGWRTLLTTPGQLDALACSPGGFCIVAGGGAPGPTLLLGRS